MFNSFNNNDAINLFYYDNFNIIGSHCILIIGIVDCFFKLL